MKNRKKVNRILPLCLVGFLVLSLAACNSQADEQNSAQPIPSTQPTAAPTPTPPPIPYTDVAEDAPYYDAVVWAYQNGIATDGETFGPADACSRGQVITFLWRAMGSPEPWIMENPFDDASPDDWYYKPALWAYQHNIATSTTVNPGNPCTSAEALTFLWRAEGKPDKLNTLASSDTYYGQPVAWADKNGLFAGVEFDPAAPCTRADLMTYLHWAVEQWTPSEEEQRIQTEYDKILYGLGIYAGYADYVDVDGDGKAELLTLEHRNDNEGVTVAIYTDVSGRVEKSCEAVFQPAKDEMNSPVDTFMTDSGIFSLYSAHGQLYLCQNRNFFEPGTYPKDDDLYDFYKIGKEAITFCEQRNISTTYDWETYEEYKIDTGTSQNYTKHKDILRLNREYSVYGGYYFKASVLDKGILPDWEEHERYWNSYWEAVDPIYAAALSGYISALSSILTGNYEGGRYENVGAYEGEVSIAIDKDGTITGDHTDSLKEALSVTVRESGEIYFETEYYEEVEVSFGYSIYIPGCATNLPVRDEPSKVRVSRQLGTDGAFEFLVKSS